MENLLISIKPQYVRQIIAGSKKFEYRKSIFKRQVERIYVYESSPVMRIIGYFQNDGYLYLPLDELWKQTSQCGGVTKSEFMEYFSGKEKGYAILIKEFHVLDEPVNPYEKFERFTPPQSFLYLGEVQG